MGFQVWREGDVTVIGIDGRLDIGSRIALKRLMLDALQHGDRDFRLDFGRCDAVDAAGLGVLASMHKRATERGGTVALAGLGEELRRLLSLTHLDLIYRLEGDGGGAADLPARVPPPAPGPLRASAPLGEPRDPSGR